MFKNIIQRVRKVIVKDIMLEDQDEDIDYGWGFQFGMNFSLSELPRP